MLLVTREKILELLLRIPGLTDRYARQEADFVPGVVAWLSDCERTLQSLRHPLAGFVAGERGLLLATADGAAQENMRPEGRSRRKIQRVAAARALARVEDRLQGVVQDIDSRFEIMRDKLAQLLAVASAHQPIAMPVAGQQRQDWLEQTWQGLSLTPETQTMYSYIQGALGKHDRLFLLGETVDNLLNG